MTVEPNKDLIKKGKATDLSKHIAEILVQHRRRKQLSQRNIADLIGVSFQQYQKYEKGKDRLSLERAIVMCERLAIPLTIFTGDDPDSATGFAESEQAGFGKTAPLTTDEQEILAIFRKLPLKSRKDFVEMIKPIAKMVTNK